MEYVYVGKIVNTHGIKGELRIISNFERKSVFNPSNKLYIGDNKEEEVISTYRVHKEFDMVTFAGYDNINQVLKYLNNKVYVNRDDLNLGDNDYLLEDLINLNVMDNNKLVGKVTNIIYNNGNTLLFIEGDKSFYIPIKSNYISKVDLKNKVINTNNVEELII